MVGIVLVTHGGIGEALLETARRKYGDNACANIRAVSVLPDDDMKTKTLPEIEEKLTEVNDNGVVILTDIFGGTPCNEAIKVFNKHPHKIDVIAGVNLPMLCRLVETSVKKIDVAVCAAECAGRDGVIKCKHPEHHREAHAVHHAA